MTVSRSVLDRLRWKPMWVSHLGSMKGCLDYLNIPVTEAWLMGATGHAFLLNMDSRATAAGPTAWNNERLMRLASNVGCVIHAVRGWESAPDFHTRQQLAWDHTKRAIDQGLPCYGWELGLPEYYVVCGYNEQGYYYSGIGTADYRAEVDRRHKADLMEGRMSAGLQAELAQFGIAVSTETEVRQRFGCFVFTDVKTGKLHSVLEAADGRLLVHDDYDRSGGCKPWRELGVSRTGFMEMCWVEPGLTPDDAVTVKQALEFALDAAEEGSPWIFPGFKSGLAGFDLWIHAVETRTADGLGLAYHAAVWSECRYFAAQFMREARERLPGPLSGLFDEGEALYAHVHHHLQCVAELFPFHQRQPSHISDTDRLEAALRHLREAKQYEDRALETLRSIYRKLDETTSCL
ncbi:hypothetical protein PAESOLCIP111_04539 [Paenibacillus solanacearum]|uniref:Uncharacterized protein n=1 Tax=Paenibacillus solanacearum TaxID=2048548 RepID=A0A916NKN1_9BACL|nr:hypothetical protein [Paenibacillus solanacearum]CAG7643728.1 hypothetical protein PAESOLCIP111_04539 [Paenibacillus solanacearum]